MKYFFSFFVVCICFTTLNAGRSVFRTKDPNTPTLKVRWKSTKETHVLQDSHLEQTPLFQTFDKQHFEIHMLPTKKISYRNKPKESVTGAELGNLVQTALEEVRLTPKRKTFTHFTMLKKRDFHNGTGLVILKFKKHPFVVKLFIETPESFVEPCQKGFESTCFFCMGGGMNRHLVGFTRIKNLENIQAKVAQHPYWKNKVYFPRKWFWIPSDVQWLELEGKNIGSGTPKTELPSVYAVIADYIDIERTFTLQERLDRRTAFALSSYLQSSIDSHINNYVIEKKTNNIVILDTEHFPTLVGLRQNPPSKSYLQWYSHLASKMVYDLFGRNKYERYKIQKRGPSPMHIASNV